MAKTGNLIAAAILALGMIIGGYLLGNGLVRADHADRSVKVRGLSERDVVADLATWTIRFTAQGSDFAAVKADAGAMEASVVQSRPTRCTGQRPGMITTASMR